jgi:hypothetical protein
MKLLKQNKNIIIKSTDKNLGPATMDTKDYVLQVLKEHLLTNAYRQLTQSEAINSMECEHTRILGALVEHPQGT